MGSLEGAGHFHPESQGFIQWERAVAADPRVEGVLGVVRHDDIRPTVVGDADVEDIDDVGVSGQPARRALLADESFPVLLVEVCGEDLDCHRAVERRLGAAVDDAETAAADLVCVLESGGCQIGRDRTRRVALRREGIDVSHRLDRFFRSEPLSKKCTTAGLSRRYPRISPTAPIRCPTYDPRRQSVFWLRPWTMMLRTTKHPPSRSRRRALSGASGGIARVTDDLRRSDCRGQRRHAGETFPARSE
ncbi:hypothetical protein JOJ86_000559 [Rhodococcus percolatus]|nr:hypothetical protein [Rhodococcus opacus]MBP2202833.1 hypothetical protein [Rhodococcus opacus]